MESGSNNTLEHPYILKPNILKIKFKIYKNIMKFNRLVCYSSFIFSSTDDDDEEEEEEACLV